MEVSNTVAIVTGASSGIGRATAHLLSQQGSKVVLVARNKEKLESVAKGIPNSLVIVADMTKKEDIKRMIDVTVNQFGRIDILINNAGRGYDTSIEEIDAKLFTELFQLNLLAPILAIKEVIPLMRKNGGGAIVNISSGTALMAIPNMGAYSSLKRALVGISLTAREEVEKDNITVSVVYPYITKTDFEKNTINSSSLQSEMNGKEELPEGDTSEYVAEKILEAITSGKAEVLAHKWMEK